MTKKQRIEQLANNLGFALSIEVCKRGPECKGKTFIKVSLKKENQFANGFRPSLSFTTWNEVAAYLIGYNNYKLGVTL